MVLERQRQHLRTCSLTEHITKPGFLTPNNTNRMSRFTVAAALLLACLVVILGGHNSVQAAVARVKLTNDAHPGKCVLNASTVLSPGQTGKLPDHPCAGATCESDGHVTIKTCKAVAPPKGCKQRDFVDTNRSFPECCERAYDCNKHI